MDLPVRLLLPGLTYGTLGMYERIDIGGGKRSPIILGMSQHRDTLWLNNDDPVMGL
jgi:hypothetical protein